MEFKELVEKAKKVQLEYRKHNADAGHHSWDAGAYMQGFVGDVGDLAKLVMAKSNYRNIENVDEKLAHELGDCLWSLMVLANELDIDLEKSFLNTMNELEERLK